MPITKNQNKKSLKFNVLKLCFILLILVLSFLYSEEIKDGVLFGMRLGAIEVIPAVFPFFVFSDYMYSSSSFGFSFPGAVFQKLFKLPPEYLRSFVLSAIFGFPVGARCCSEQYKSSGIREYTERAICLCSNPSMAFTVFAVGGVMLSDIYAGFCLYFSVVLSTVILGILYGRNEPYEAIPQIADFRSFSLSASINSAGTVSLSVCSFITFFSAVIALAKCFLKNELSIAFVSSFLEVGNAVSHIISAEADELLRIGLLGFALGFSGLSVLCQARAALPRDIRLFKLYIFKISEGALCAFIASAFYFLFFK